MYISIFSGCSGLKDSEQLILVVFRKPFIKSPWYPFPLEMSIIEAENSEKKTSMIVAEAGSKLPQRLGPSFAQNSPLEISHHKESTVVGERVARCPKNVFVSYCVFVSVCWFAIF